MMDRPLCFVLMPFGVKRDPAGGADIDFDAIYDEGLRPGIEAAGMEPIRADEERTGGIIHRAMFERLLLCDYAVADLTTANANVFYELGVRHATRPATTLAIYAANQRLPFDLNFLRSMPYDLSEGNRLGPEASGKLRSAIAKKLTDVRVQARIDAPSDSPLFQLLTDYRAPDIARLKTDTFREQVRYSNELKQRIAVARRAEDRAALGAVQASLGSLDAVESGVVIDLFLSYRALAAHAEMEALYGAMPVMLQRSVLVREQLAFALNRMKRRDEALRILEQVLAEKGPSSETYGLMGRIYKDLWLDAQTSGDTWSARGHLDRAIAMYMRGFEADWRDPYPGINAVTLLDLKGDPPSLVQQGELLPVVRFAVAQKLRSAKPDYWDHATLLELAVLASDFPAAEKALGDALGIMREAWEPETTANNLTLIREARRNRDGGNPRLDTIIVALNRASTR